MERGSPEWEKIKSEMEKKYKPNVRSRVLIQISQVDPFKAKACYYIHDDFFNPFLLMGREEAKENLLKVLDQLREGVLLRYKQWWGED